MSISHQHDYEASNKDATRRLKIACLICIVFMIVEIIGGFIANSLAIMTDASHLLSDMLSFAISLFAIHMSSKPGTLSLSFGYHRAEILGALVSILFIWLLTAWLVYEAILRVISPQPVNGFVMMVTASIGLIANIGMTWLLGVHSHGLGQVCDGHTHDHAHGSCAGHNQNKEMIGHSHAHSHPHECNDSHHDHQDCTHEHSHENQYVAFSSPSKLDSHNHTHASHRNVNLHAAYIHAIGDLIQNLGVLLAAFIVYKKPEWTLADPICTFLFSVLVLYTTFSIMSDALNVLMEGVPSHISPLALEQDLLSVVGVVEVHDLHIWSLSVGKPAMSVHVVTRISSNYYEILKACTEICQKKYNILHSTVQVDVEGELNSCETSAHAKCSHKALNNSTASNERASNIKGDPNLYTPLLALNENHTHLHNGHVCNGHH